MNKRLCIILHTPHCYIQHLHFRPYACDREIPAQSLEVDIRILFPITFKLGSSFKDSIPSSRIARRVTARWRWELQWSRSLVELTLVLRLQVAWFWGLIPSSNASYTSIWSMRICMKGWRWWLHYLRLGSTIRWMKKVVGRMRGLRFQAYSSSLLKWMLHLRFLLFFILNQVFLRLSMLGTSFPLQVAVNLQIP